MKLTIQLKFIIVIALIHLVTLVLSFYIFEKNKVFFIISEFFILLSLAICWTLYNDIIQPLQLLMRGVDAINDKDFTVKFVETGRYEMDKLIGVYNKMIDQLRTERTVQQEQHFFLDKLIQTSPTGIIILDFDGNIKSLNPKAEQILLQKGEILREKTDNSLLNAISLMKKGDNMTINTEGVQKFKLQKAAFIDKGFEREFVMLEDMTTEILQAEKQAYGKVIRLMAHEVNNSIGAVNSILDTTLKYERDADMSNALKIAIERNDHLNHFMRNFANIIRLPEPHIETIDLLAILKKSITLMEYKAREKDIRFKLTQNTEGVFSINADVEQMEQVLINIIKNAIEAIDNQGFIRFIFLEKTKELWIEDTGNGISKDIEHNLFSPFFTTKHYGQGVGLTLIRDILSNHNFTFSLQNRVEGGAVFKIAF
jgi:two-component system, NtrC family, nitrogen regulation sensor histidine kinase NtrY